MQWKPKVHAKLYKALENIDETEEVFYYLSVCGNIEKAFLKMQHLRRTGSKFIKY